MIKTVLLIIIITQVGMARIIAGTLPAEVLALGYTNCVIDEHPDMTDIAPGKNGSFKWFSGEWYNQSPPERSHYFTTNNLLAMSMGGELVSMPRDFSSGLLPLISGANGFYVEFEVWLSDNDADHWPALWLMPAEHNGKNDCYTGDPTGFERWMDLDVDEGGFGPGVTGTVHSWNGIYPNFKNLQNHNNVCGVSLDRTQKHKYGACYDLINNRVSWYLDGNLLFFAGYPYVPSVVSIQHYYIIISAQSHGLNKPYTMYVSRINAYMLSMKSLLPPTNLEIVK